MWTVYVLRIVDGLHDQKKAQCAHAPHGNSIFTVSLEKDRLAQVGSILEIDERYVRDGCFFRYSVSDRSWPTEIVKEIPRVVIPEQLVVLSDEFLKFDSNDLWLGWTPLLGKVCCPTPIDEHGEFVKGRKIYRCTLYCPYGSTTPEEKMLTKRCRTLWFARKFEAIPEAQQRDLGMEFVVSPLQPERALRVYLPLSPWRALPRRLLEAARNPPAPEEEPCQIQINTVFFTAPRCPEDWPGADHYLQHHRDSEDDPTNLQ